MSRVTNKRCDGLTTKDAETLQNLAQAIWKKFSNSQEGTIPVIPSNRPYKEVWNYQESLFFGLSLRQFLFALMAVLVLYFSLCSMAGK